MPRLESRSKGRSHRSTRAIAFVAVAVAATACGGEVPTATQTTRELSAPLALEPDAAAPRPQAWNQGFESGAEGWYDARTDGALGWCGSIDVVDGGRGRTDGLRASAGRRYAEVRGGACNAYWSSLGIPGGGPYAPGHEAALYSGRWPTAGYVSELDIYLDPAWSGAALGSLGLVLRPTPYPTAIFQIAATIMPRDYQLGTPHPAPHWFVPVEAVPGEEALTVLEHRVDEAGWYTFRFLFGETDGEVTAAFEFRGRKGPVLMRVDDLPAEALAGPIKVPFAESLSVNDYGMGHLWFFDAPVDPNSFSPVAVAIDEHRVRPGR